MKVTCGAVVCLIIIACCFAGPSCAFGQDDGAEIGTADVKTLIDLERATILELRQRQANAEREKSLLVAEIESETRRISKLNRTIKLANPPVKRSEVQRATKAAVPSRAPAAPAPAPDARLTDAESQAEIDRLSTMKNDLISEKNMLEHVVKQGY